MKVLVTGATGFTGSYVIPVLLEHGIQVRCYVRSSSNRGFLPASSVEWAVGDIGDEQSLSEALEGVDAFVNIASLGVGHAETIVNTSAKQVKRAIFVSTTALFTTLPAKSKLVRLAAEDTITKSALDYTILRPTMIYGSSRDRNICRLIGYLQRYPVLPIFGTGEFLQQPVYVGDVAAAIASALTRPQAARQAYNIPGATALTYNELIDTVCRLLNRRVMKLHVPSTPIISTLRFAETFSRRLPIKSEQILRLNEHKNFDYGPAARDLDYHPLSFAEGVSRELEDMSLSRSGHA